MSWKVGRNDPCPCGSGKKYKKCCGLIGDIRNASLDPFERYNDLFTDIKLKLDSYFASTIKRMRRDYRQTFLFYTVNHTLPGEHESLYSDWLWFDRQSSDQPSLAQRYLEENGAFMEKPLQECLQALCASALSVYQVVDSQDMLLQVRDLFTNEKQEVLLKEPWQNSSDSGVLILGRLVPIDQGQIFSGMVLLTEDTDGEKEEFINSHYRYIRQLDLFPSGLPAPVNYGLFDHAHKKKLFSLRDMRMAAIDSAQLQSLQNQLAQHDQLVLAHTTEQIAWYIPKKDHHGYVRLAVGPNYMATAADVLEDVVFLQEQVKDLLPMASMELVHSALQRSFPPGEKADIWLAIMKDQQAEKWMDTAHNELDGQTPRQVMAEAGGKTRLLEMLRDFSQSVQSPDEQEFIDFMKARVESAPIP